MKNLFHRKLPITTRILEFDQSLLFGTFYFWPQTTGTSAHNKCPLMFIETSGLLLILNSFHILTRADVVICLLGKDACSASHLMPVTAKPSRRTKSILPKINIVRPQISKTLYASNIRWEQFLFSLEDRHSLALQTILPLSFCLPGILALSAGREGRRSPTWHEGRMIPEQPVDFTP